MYVFYRFCDNSEVLSIPIPKCYLDTYFKMARLMITQENASPILLLSMGTYFAGKEIFFLNLGFFNSALKNYMIFNLKQNQKRRRNMKKSLTSFKEKKIKSTCECKSS